MGSIPGNAATFVTSGPVARLAAPPGAGVVAAEVDGALFALDERGLTGAAGTGNRLAFEPSAACRRVNDGFIGWTLDARRRAAVASYTGFGEVTPLLPPKAGEAPAAPRTVEVPLVARPMNPRGKAPGDKPKPLPIGTLMLADEGPAALAITIDESRRDMTYHHVSCVDTGSGSILNANVLVSARPWGAGWSAAMRAFLLFDGCAGRLYALAPGSPPRVLLEGRSGVYAVNRFASNVRGDWVVALVETAGGPALLNGAVVDGELEWGVPAPLPPGSYEHLACHPERKAVLAERHFKRGTALVVVDLLGSVRNEIVLPRGWMSTTACFSGTGHHAFAANDTHLLAWRH